MDQSYEFTRRKFLQITGQAAVIGGLASVGVSRSDVAAEDDESTIEPPLVWVWKFSTDGPPETICETLAAHGLGIILKTHDGDEWMSRFDESPDAVSGPHQIANLAATFERAGVPFHAWSVTQGKDPIAEARMCAQVLDAGARSLFLDLEPPEKSNYWQGDWQDALRFGGELRRLRPDAWVTVAPDARPWQGALVPLAEFISFSNAVAPQAYWATFNSPTNRRYLIERGYAVGPEGVTPELIIDVSIDTFRQFGRPIRPIGEGAASPDMWQRFIRAASAGGMNPVSLWRYGSTDPAMLAVLRNPMRLSSRSVVALPVSPFDPTTEAEGMPSSAEATKLQGLSAKGFGQPKQIAAQNDRFQLQRNLLNPSRPNSTKSWFLR